MDDSRPIGNLELTKNFDMLCSAFKHVQTFLILLIPACPQMPSASGLSAHLGTDLVLRGRVTEGEHRVDLRDRNRDDHDRPERLEGRRLSGGRPIFSLQYNQSSCHSLDTTQARSRILSNHEHEQQQTHSPLPRYAWIRVHLPKQMAALHLFK